MHLAFSDDGKKLLSIGMDKSFSMQVFRWEQSRSIVYRNSGALPILAAKFNPYDDNEFVTCGYEHMAVWRMRGCHLSCSSFQRLVSLAGQFEESKEDTTMGQRSILTCIDFVSYKLGHSIQSDVLFGSNQGDVSTYCSGKHFVLREEAHKAAINCLRVTDHLSDVRCFVYMV